MSYPLPGTRKARSKFAFKTSRSSRHSYKNAHSGSKFSRYVRARRALEAKGSRPSKLDASTKGSNVSREVYTAATWNVEGLTEVKFEAVMQDGYDMLALTELHGRPQEAWEFEVKYPNRVFCSLPSVASDPRAGAAVLLSERMSKRVMAWKAEGTRMVWVRLSGEDYNLIFVAVYVPHAWRVEPSQADGLRALETLCRTLRQRFPKDQMVVGMDANAKLQRNQPGLTGHACMHYYQDSGGDRLVELMNNTHLQAASTYFSSPRSQSLGQATYVDDKHGSRPSQIDYLLCTRKHMPNMLSCRVRWERSINSKGNKRDHGLVCMRMRFRIRNHKTGQESMTVCRKALGTEEGKTQLQEDYLEAKGFCRYGQTISQKLDFESLDARFKRMHADMTQALSKAPKVKKQQPWRREVSVETIGLLDERQRQCQAAKARGTEVREVKRYYRRLLSRSVRRDKRSHVAAMINDVVAADDRKDSKAWWRACHRISGKSKRYNQTAPSADSTEALAERWAVYAETSFAASNLEAARARVPIPPAKARAGQGPSRETVLKHLRGLSKNRAAGPSSIPIEAWKASSSAEADLVQVVLDVFELERLPSDMALSEFIWIWKRKGDSDSMSQYRPISLEEHSMKCVASVALEQLVRELRESKFLPPTQAGFRKGRSVRDNSYVLRQIINLAVELKEDLVITFIDLKNAFPSVSHACMAQALKAAGASDKSLAMFYALYENPRARSRVTGADGTRVVSREVPIRRGVLQGSLISPVYFIVALEYVFKMADPGGTHEVLGGILDQLFYADDAALLSGSVEEASVRLEAISAGLKNLADMTIHLGKTVGMHAQETIQVAKPEAEDYATEEATLLRQCKCEGCGDEFTGKHGLGVHQATCDSFLRMSTVRYEVSKVVDSRGPPHQRFYLLHYKGYGREDRQWVPDEWCKCDRLIEEYWKRLGLSADVDTVPEAPNPLVGDRTYGFTHRCVRCCKFFKTAEALKGHGTRSVAKGGCTRKPQVFSGRLAEKAVMRMWRKQAQEQFEHIKVHGTVLENVLSFTYLGSNFEADGDSRHDMQQRMAMAKKQFGAFYWIWQADEVSLKQKLRLYSAGVLSILAFGHESWDLDRETRASLKGWNARCMSRITGRSVAEENRHPTYDLVGKLAARRLKWAGQVLRQDPNESIVHRVVVAVADLDLQSDRRRPSLLMDAPAHESVEELVELARDEQGWATAVKELDSCGEEAALVFDEWADEHFPEVCGSSLNASAEVFVPAWPELGSAVKVKTEPKTGLRRSKRVLGRGKINYSY